MTTGPAYVNWPGIESWQGARNSAPVQTGPGAHRFSCKRGNTSVSQRVNQLGSGTDYQHLHTVDVKERVELYLCSPTKPLWHVYLYGYLQFTRNGVTSPDLQNQTLDSLSPHDLGGGWNSPAKHKTGEKNMFAFSRNFGHKYLAGD